MGERLVLALGHRFASLDIERQVLSGVARVIDGNSLHDEERARALSEVDGVILVVREGHVPVAHLKEAVGMLRDANILGVVYNDVEVNRYSSYHYFSYKNYSYHAGQGGA